MYKTVEYHMIVKDVLRDSEFVVKCDSEAELKSRYRAYKNDTDYTVVAMYSLLLELRPIMAEDIEGKAM